MKNQKAIAALSETAKAIVFPKYDTARARFAAQLRQLISLNFSVAERDVSYTDDDCTYYWHGSAL